MADGSVYEDESQRCALDRVFGSLKEGREPYVPLWRDLADNFYPFRGRWLNERPNQALKRNLKIINETPIIARRTFGAGMQVSTTSQARPWFRLKTVADELMEEDGVREWLYAVETDMRNTFSQSNFYGSVRVGYEEYGTFGNLAMGIFEDSEKGIHCCTYTAGSFYFSRNAKDVVDTFAVEFKWTVRAIVQRWVKNPKNADDPGWKNISPAVRDAWFRKQRETFVDLVYLVIPNNTRDLGRADAKGKPFLAYYFEPSREAGERILEESGFNEFPIMNAALALNQGDSYGNGLALDALGSAKALQLQEKRKAIIIDKEADPPMKGHPSLRNQKTSQLPGDVTFVEPGVGNVGFEPVAQWKPDRSGMIEDISGIEERVRTVFFADIFALFIQGEQDADETATKTAAKQQEKLMMLGPVVESATTMLNATIDRVFAIRLRQGAFPRPPDALMGQALKIEHVSILAQAQNLAAVQGVTQFTGFVLGLAAQQFAAGVAPTALDKLDMDQTIDEMGNLSGVVPTIIVPDQRVAEIREARAKAQAAAQQQAQAMEQAQAGAKTAKDLSQANLDGNNALSAIANG